MSLFESASLVVTPNGTKASKLYAVKPVDGSGDLTVTRATTATRVNSAGLIESVASNVPRLDYTNGTCPSILVEPQRTNVQTYSEDFSNAIYLQIGVTVTTNAIIAPDGNTTADKLVEDTSTGLHTIDILNPPVVAGSYTVSVFVKAAERTKFQILGFFALTGNIDFDLTAGTATTTAPALNGKIENYGNGWFRCSATFTDLTGVGAQILFNILNNAGSNNYTGTSGSGLYLWGAQLELGSDNTSYIPTTTASVTRNADVISKTGISSLIGQTEGTLFIDANISLRSNTRVLLDVQDGTNNDTFQFVLGGNSLTVNIYDGGILQAGLNGGYCLGRKKIALGYKANDFVLYIDGVQIATDTSGSIPAASLIALGYLYIAGGFELGDSINTFANWKTRLSNSELGTLTTL